MMQTCCGELKIDTKDICLWCLGSRIDSNCVDSPSSVPSFQRLKHLLRYLKVSPKQLFNCSSEFLQLMEIREDISFQISLCSKCSSVIEKFNQLYHEYEIIQLQLGDCVQSLHELISSGNENPERVQKYKDQMRPTNSSELVNASVAANLRNETFIKCSLQIQSGTTTGQVVSDKANSWICSKLPKTGGVEDEKTTRGKTRSLKNAEYTKLTDDPQQHEIDVVPQTKPVIRNLRRGKSYFSSIRKNLKTKSYPNGGGGGIRRGTFKICEYCETRCSSKQSLRTHVSLLHPERLVSKFLPSHVSSELCKQGISAVWKEMFKKSRYDCQLCKIKLTHQPNLKHHLIRKHAEELAVKVLEHIPSLSETSQNPELTKETMPNVTVSKFANISNPNPASDESKFACEYCKNCWYTSSKGLRHHKCCMHPEYIVYKFFPPHIPLELCKEGVDTVLEPLLQQTSESGFTCKYCTTNIVNKTSFKLHVVSMHAEQIALEAQQCLGLTEQLEVVQTDSLACSNTWSNRECESGLNPSENINDFDQSDGPVEMDFEIEEKLIKIENAPTENVDLDPLDTGDLD